MNDAASVMRESRLAYVTVRINGERRCITCLMYEYRTDASFPGLYKYECRSADGFDEPKTIENNVLVNFAGTIFTKSKLPVDGSEDSYIEIEDMGFEDWGILQKC